MGAQKDTSQTHSLVLQVSTLSRIGVHRGVYFRKRFSVIPLLFGTVKTHAAQNYENIDFHIRHFKIWRKKSNPGYESYSNYY